MIRRMTTVVLIGLLLTAPGILYAQEDIDEFKAFYGKWFNLFNTLDFDTMATMMHEDAVMFLPNAVFAVEGRDMLKAVFSEAKESIASWKMIPVNIKYNVIGNTGIAYGQYTSTLTLKNGPPTYYTGRFIEVFVKENGNWKFVAAQDGEISVGD
ncbi:MAG: nuclear transport factor 2 family protein [Desulfobacterales bacterium]